MTTEAKIAVTAQDKFSAVFKALRGELDSSIAGARGMGAALGGIGAAITGLAAAGGVVSLIRGITDEVARLAALEDAAVGLGSTVEQMSKLEAVARVVGAPLSDIVSIGEKLIKGLSAPDEETSGVRRALNKLGVEAEDSSGKLRDIGVVIQEAAIKLNGYGDSIQKTALVTDLLGKGSAKNVNLLNDIGKAGDIAATATAAQAAAAGELEDKLRALSIQWNSNRTALAVEFTPVLLATTEAISNLIATSRGVEAGGSAIQRFAIGSVEFLALLADAIPTVASRMRGLGADLEGVAQYAKGSFDRIAASAAIAAGDYRGAAKIWSESNQRFTEGAAAFARAQQLNSYESRIVRDTLAASLGTYDDARDRTAKLAGAQQEGVKATLDYVAGTKAAKGGVDELSKSLEVYNRLVAVDAGVTASYAKDVAALELAYRAGKISVDQYAAAVKTLVAQQPGVKAFEKSQEDAAKAASALVDLLGDRFSKAAEEYEAALDRAAKAGDDVENAILEQVKALELERDTFGLTVTARKLYINEVERSKALLSAENEARRAGINALFDEKAALIEANAGREQQAASLAAQADAWKTVESASNDFFEDLFLNGKDAFGNLERTAKQFFAKMAAQFATRFVLDAVLNVSGGGGGGGGGIGNILGSLFGGSSGGGGSPNILGSLSGGGGLFGSLGNLFGAGTGLGNFFGAASGGFIGSLGTLSTALTSGVAAAGGLATTLGAAIPVIGPIIALAAALGAFKDEKGFKFDNAADAGGRNRTQLIASPFGNYDFAGDFDNKIVQPFIDAVAKIDNSIVDTFLVSDAELESARARVQAIKDGSWFGANDEGETAESINAATLRFLKERYGTIFSTIDSGIASAITSFTGTADELLQYVGNLAALQPALAALRDRFPDLALGLSDFSELTEQQRAAIVSLGQTLPTSFGDAWEQIQEIQARATRGLVSMFQENARASIDLINKGDGAATTLEALANASGSAATAFAQIQAQIAGFASGLAAQLSSTQEEFLLATLSADEKYKYFQEQADKEIARLATLTDAEDIDRATRRADDLQRQAFGLLSDEERRRLLPEFLQGSQNLDALSQTRLSAAAEAAQASNRELADVIAKAMLAAIEEQKKTVATQGEASNTQRDASLRFAAAVEQFASSTIAVELLDRRAPETNGGA